MIKNVLENEFRECYDVMITAYEAAEEKERKGLQPRGRKNKYEDLFSEYKSGHMFFGYHVDGKIIGMIRIIYKENNMCQVKDIAVLPEYQQKGYGRELIEFAKTRAKELGANKVDLGFFLDNAALKRWYERQGFTLRRTITHTYNGSTAIIGIMECEV